MSTMGDILRSARLFDVAVRQLQLLAWVQRPLKVRRYFSQHRMRKLQLGAGKNSLPGWLNTDMLITPSALIEKDRTLLDATGNFPFPDNSFHYVFSEHMIEHVDFQNGQRTLSECFRVLRPGGKIRLATPNMQFLIDLFTTSPTKLQARYLKEMIEKWQPKAAEFGLYEPNMLAQNFVRNWGHRFIYDPATLQRALELAGFVNITAMEVGLSNDPDLTGLEAHGEAIGQDFNQLETMVMEAQKPNS